MKRICMVVPNRMVKGGIAAVVNGYRGSQLEKHYEITYVESYKDGNKFDKLLKGICGYFHFACVLLFHKPDLVHIHSSFGPSFYRKMPFIYMAFLRNVPIINHIHGADFDEFFALCKPEASLFQGKLSKNNAYHHFSAFPPHTSLIFSLNTANQVFARIFR